MMESTLLTISLLVEEDSDIAARVAHPLRAEEEIRKAVLLAVAVLLADGGRADVRVECSSLNSLTLNETEGYGRCAVCNCWVYDAERADGLTGSVATGFPEVR